MGLNMPDLLPLMERGEKKMSQHLLGVDIYSCEERFLFSGLASKDFLCVGGNMEVLRCPAQRPIVTKLSVNTCLFLLYENVHTSFLSVRVI